MTNWISVKDRLPDKRISVLIYDDSYNEIHTAEFCDSEICDRWHISFGKYSYDPSLAFERNDITHWMPLPEKPNE